MGATIKLGNKVMVSDPCYGLDTWCQGVLENVLPGNYNCYVEYSDEGDWGERVSAIEVVHEKYDRPLDIEFESEDFEVGVDSGQAGIFDYDYYVRYHNKHTVDDSWYDRVCALTCENVKNPNYEEFDWNADNCYDRYQAYKETEKCWPYIQKLTANPIDGLGYVSSSGYGDGGYTCWTARDDDGNIITIRVEFITEYDEEDDE
jgi:hypothetical protein